MDNYRLPYASIIERKALGEIATFVAAEENGSRIYDSVSASHRQVAVEYFGRFLHELLQNSYDAQPSGTTDGRVLVQVADDEGLHGVLYVANTGLPFSESNFNALCDIGLSDKSIGEGIGNKGLGFRSVLSVSEWPEIYSRALDDKQEYGPELGGFCFSFATPEDVHKLTNGDQLLTNRLCQHVSPYMLPVPLSTQPERVGLLAARGFNTVFRLRLRNAEAHDRVLQGFEAMRSSEVPMHLFLDRIADIRLEWISEARQETQQLTRRILTTVPLDGGGSVSEVELDGESRYFVFLSRSGSRLGYPRGASSPRSRSRKRPSGRCHTLERWCKPH